MAVQILILTLLLSMVKQNDAHSVVIYHSEPSVQEVQAVIVENSRAYYIPSVLHLDSLWDFGRFKNPMEIKDSTLLSFLLNVDEDEFQLSDILKKCHCALTKNNIGISFDGSNWYNFGEVRHCKPECSNLIQIRLSDMFIQLKSENK